MRHRLFVVLLLLATVVVGAPAAACVCRCAPLEPAEQMKHAAAVFTGTVTGVRHVSGDRLGPTPPVVYRFRPDQIYKGGPAAEFEVATNVNEASCGYAFTVGSQYLVFASDKESGLLAIDPGVPLNTSLCAGNQPVRPGDRPLRAEDGVQNGEPLTAELLAALGMASRPAPTTSLPPATPSRETATTPWAAIGAITAAVAVLALAGWRFARRRKT
ncbi:hypothetical protein Pta02_11760 [Planobispora takensis]|uniref:Tissue inhibitor of metalloproteinase n=2 Tax=Planobispora takensis TaxID=1367882 RepID=A0A8J3WSE3_9ACTN|nr:hypothetical protein Pta02_11760 [Planobispora takensis]